MTTDSNLSRAKATRAKKSRSNTAQNKSPRRASATEPPARDSVNRDRADRDRADRDRDDQAEFTESTAHTGESHTGESHTGKSHTGKSAPRKRRQPDRRRNDDDANAITPTEPIEVTDPDPSRPLHWKKLALHALPMYIASRAAVVAGAAVVAAELRVDGNLAAEKGLPNQDPHGLNIGTNAVRPMINVFTSWDGKWYMDVVRLGYPKSVPAGVTYFVDEARTAFFPLFPAVGHAFDWIVPGGDTAAVLLLNLLLGFAAVLIAGLMAQRMYGPAVARRTVTIMAIFPGSFVFSFAYSEALMITLAGLCLWALYERRWWSASIFGMLTTLTRPNGVAVVVAAFAVLIAELRKPKEERDLRAALPVVIAPLGFVSFQLYLWAHTGESGVWFRVQREAWDEGASFGWTALRNTFEAFASPLTSPTDTITALSLVATGVLVYFAWKVRLNLILSAYSATILVLMLAPATVTARPRFLFTAFPLLIAGSLWVEQRRSEEHTESFWTITVMLCGAGLAAVTGLYGVYGAIP